MNFLLTYFNKIRPEKFFIFISLIFGTLIQLITPPFHVPDEPNHFYRAWQISEGGFISVKQDKRVGGYLPSNLEKETLYFTSFVWNKKSKIGSMEILKHLDVLPDGNERKFYDFNNTALYSPICYFPASLALFLCKTFNTSPLYGFYAARFFTFVSWIIALFFCIKTIPVYKWFFTFLALLPMSLFINIALSADVVTNAVCFLFITFVLRYALDTHALDSKRSINLFLLIFLLAAVKIVYVALLLILFIIPRSKFLNTKDYVQKITGLFLSGFAFTFFWYTLLNPLYISYDAYHHDFRGSAALVNGADAEKQFEYIISHGTYLFFVFLKSFHLAFEMYYRGYIGTFGWMDTSMPWWFVNTAYIFILLLSVMDVNKAIRITWKQKLTLLFTFLSTLFLLLLSQHLTWDYVGADVILTIQGRYLIPFIPLLFILFYNRRFPYKQLIGPLTILTVVVSMLYTLQLIYFRYF